MDPLAFCDDTLRTLRERAQYRSIRSLSSAQDPLVRIDGEELILLASNNYLGLATHPRVVEAAQAAAQRWGVGAGSARLVTGSTSVHDELEARLAAFKGADASLLFSSGYTANLGAIAALAGRDDAIFSDASNHASIIDGARLSRASVHVYRHADVGHLESLLRATDARRRLVVTDAVFSMDGDAAPVREIADVCERHGAMLMVDEAHSSGVVGPGGRGLVAACGLEGRVHVVMGTLSKALGGLGGYIAGERRLIDHLRNTARAFIFDTALPPHVVAAALAGLDVVEAEPDRVERVRANARRLARGLGLPDPAAAIVPLVIGTSDDALAAGAAARSRGVLIPAIRPPSVPEGTARLRATVMSTHTDEQIDHAIAALRR